MPGKPCKQNGRREDMLSCKMKRSILGKSFSSSSMVASTISLSGLPIHSSAGAKTSSSMDLFGSAHARHEVDISCSRPIRLRRRSQLGCPKCTDATCDSLARQEARGFCTYHDVRMTMHRRFGCNALAVSAGRPAESLVERKP